VTLSFVLFRSVLICKVSEYKNNPEVEGEKGSRMDYVLFEIKSVPL
jgi:hypothetical protein